MRPIATKTPRRTLAVFASASPDSSNASSSHKNDAQAATASRRKALILSGATAFAAAVSVAPPPRARASAESSSSSSSSAATAVQRAPVAPLTPRERDAVAAYESASPSIVNVFDLALLRAAGGGVAFGSGAAEPEGNGSGVLWRDGASGRDVVVTNYHVLASSLDRITKSAKRGFGGGISDPGPTVARIVAATPDGARRALDAAVVGVDASHDIAVLTLLGGASASVNGGNGDDDFFAKLRPIERAETAKKLRVGQQVFAIGNPFGFSLSMSGGVVSGLDRSFESKVASSSSSSSSSSAAAASSTATGNATINGAILHSAPQNPGSSGGAVVDSSGRLVGLSTAIFTDTGANVGLSFALPVDLLERVVPQLVARGAATNFGAGVSLATPAVAAALLPAPSSSNSSSASVPPGVMIASVAAGSGAERAGLLPVRRTLSGIAAGDVVVAVGGRPCADAGAFSSALEEISSSIASSPSTTSTIEVEFDVVRDVGTGQQKREKVKVVLAPE